MRSQHWATLQLTALAMLAFAANSVLCRMALTAPLIDAASFTIVRLAAGAIMLTVLMTLRHRGSAALLKAGSWPMAAALFAYAAAFSFAYVSLHASVGALILFGAVQATMIGVGFARGERLTWLQSAGALIAVLGLVYLVAPGLHAPDPRGALLMAGAGAAWGCYSLLGRSARIAALDPTLVTTGNFIRAAPLALIPLLFVSSPQLSAAGVALAIASGALSSGLGYAIWYAALKHLAASEAAIVQLTVPVIAALGGIAFLHEPLSLRFVMAAIAILGGVALVLARRRPQQT